MQRGLDAGFISRLTENTVSAVELNNEQERRKPT
jgi:hypothetical protein